MQISEAILHHIVKVQHERGANVAPRDQLLAINNSLERLADSIHRRYNEKYVLHGSFIDNPDVHRFPVLLKQYLDETNNLITFSNSAAQIISTEMGKKTTTTSSFAKFLRYQSGAKDWLLVLMLKTSAQTGINLDTLELDESYVFDIQHLYEAARIDISKFLNDEVPYLTFVKPRSGKDDPSDYFRDALGCTDFTNPKHNTTAVMNALDAYAENQSWDVTRKQEARRTLYNHLKEKSDNRQSVNLEALSAILDDQDPRGFRDFVAEEDFEVNSTFDPHPATFKRLKRLSHKFSNINISFDIEDLIDGNIDVENVDGQQKIIINNVPQNILSEILRAKGQ